MDNTVRPTVKGYTWGLSRNNHHETMTLSPTFVNTSIFFKYSWPFVKKVIPISPLYYLCSYSELWYIYLYISWSHAWWWFCQRIEISHFKICFQCIIHIFGFRMFWFLLFFLFLWLSKNFPLVLVFKNCNKLTIA